MKSALKIIISSSLLISMTACSTTSAIMEEGKTIGRNVATHTAQSVVNLITTGTTTGNTTQSTKHSIKNQRPQTIEIYGLIGWIEKDCGFAIHDEHSALAKAQQEYGVFIESPNASKYRNIVADYEASGHGDTNIDLKNAVYRGLPVTQIANISGYESGSFEMSFDTSVSVNALKPYLKDYSAYSQNGEGLQIDSTNNRIVCAWAM